MNNTNGTCLPATGHISISVLMCLVFFVGFLLNMFSLWVFFFRMSSWSSGTVLQFNLALSDALATPVTPLMAVYFAMGNEWIFGQFLCQAKIALLSSHFYGSTIFLTLISVHRYTAVVNFNKSSRMKNKDFIKKICAGVWLLLFLQSLVYSLILPTTKEGKRRQCFNFSQKKLSNIYYAINFVLFTVGFLLPLSISAGCYFGLANTLTRLNTSTQKGLKVKLKSQRMIRMCLLIFGICFLPMNVIRTTGVILIKHYPQRCSMLQAVQMAYYASWIFAGVNGCLDPLLYCFGSHSFRNAFRFLKMNQAESQGRNDSETTANQLE
ncbi:P2Y purinoceptor 2-like [Boleophthalmus pectinirostris]|uniref:P2Y purinoceptor 2-like n=1 Tax=Boleophthalmus pectinirostris TaxID=150288 RepID=UPI00242DDBD3|nr:P2Y purinoceptor 2-like [Boleophthalmus pectinirostris]